MLTATALQRGLWKCQQTAIGSHVMLSTCISHGMARKPSTLLAPTSCMRNKHLTIAHVLHTYWLARLWNLPQYVSTWLLSSNFHPVPALNGRSSSYCIGLGHLGPFFEGQLAHKFAVLWANHRSPHDSVVPNQFQRFQISFKDCELCWLSVRIRPQYTSHSSSSSLRTRPPRLRFFDAGFFPMSSSSSSPSSFTIKSYAGQLAFYSGCWVKTNKMAKHQVLWAWHELCAWAWNANAS